jgi:hypothetical protein
MPLTEASQRPTRHLLPGDEKVAFISAKPKASTDKDLIFELL